MKYQFCTLFDKNYIYKGLSLYNSLLKNCPDFTLWILCMDEATLDILTKLDLKKGKLISRAEFEDPELLKVKPTRTVAEYCWTCTPSLPLFVLKKDPSIDMIAYLDADLFFFSDPAPVYEEFGNNSIMIIEHRFPDHLKHLEENGIYNVEMLIFRNNEQGIRCLTWWRERCLEWCYYRLEDGKLGDQKYLDDWTVRFPGVHVLQHKGAGVALWNIMRYSVTQRGRKTFIDDAELVFYHFHAFTLVNGREYRIGNNSNYPITRQKIKFLYEPYMKSIREAIDQVKKVDDSFRFGFTLSETTTLRARVRTGITRIPGRLKKLFIGTGDW